MECPLEMLVVAEYTSQHDNCGSQAEQIKILLQVLTAASHLPDFSWRGNRLRCAGVINP